MIVNERRNVPLFDHEVFSGRQQCLVLRHVPNLGLQHLTSINLIEKINPASIPDIEVQCMV